MEVDQFENLKVVFLHKVNIGDRTIWLSIDDLFVQRACYEEQCRLVGKDLSDGATYDALKDCVLLERCLKETLRLRPPIVTIMRLCKTPQVSTDCSDDGSASVGLITVATFAFTIYHSISFLADHTNGRTYATVLRQSSVCRL